MNEIQEIEKSVPSLVAQAKQLMVIDNPTYERASLMVVDIKTMMKRICDTFDPIIAKANAVHKESCKQKNKFYDPLEEAERILKPHIGAYLDIEEKKRRDREAELQKEAQKIVEQEALDRAIEAEKAGDKAAANAILENEAVAPPVIVTPTTPKIEGQVTKKIWKYRIKDAKKINSDFLIPDEKKIGAVVRSMKKDAERLVGGIEVYAETSIAQSAR